MSGTCAGRRYFAAVYEGGNNGGACRGFLMEQMDEDLLTHLTDRPELQPIPVGAGCLSADHGGCMCSTFAT